MVFGLSDHDAVDQDARYFDLTGRKTIAFGKPLNLGDDDPTRVSHCHGDGQHLQSEGLFLHGQITLRVPCNCPDNADVDRKRFVE